MVRIKHRYLLVNILSPESENIRPSKSTASVPNLIQFHAPSPDSFTPQLFSRLIKEQVSLLYGDYGLGLVSGSLKILYLSPATSTAIVRVARDHYRIVWAALAFITEVPNAGKAPKRCVMRVVRVSGTVRKAEEEAIRRARMAILKAKGEMGVEALTAMLGKGGDEGGIMEVNEAGQGPEEDSSESG